MQSMNVTLSNLEDGESTRVVAHVVIVKPTAMKRGDWYGTLDGAVLPGPYTLETDDGRSGRIIVTNVDSGTSRFQGDGSPPE